MDSRSPDRTSAVRRGKKMLPKKFLGCEMKGRACACPGAGKRLKKGPWGRVYEGGKKEVGSELARCHIQ